MVGSIATQPRTDGPTTIPATISSTTAGTRKFGARPSRNGAAKATATTMSSPSSEGMPVQSPGGRVRYVRRCACTRRRYARAFSRPPQTRIEHHVLVRLMDRS